MANLTIRNLDDTLKAGLRLRAARHGRSIEEEARLILKQAVQAPAIGAGLGTRIHRRFADIGGDGIAPPNRTPTRQPPDFGDMENV